MTGPRNWLLATVLLFIAAVGLMAADAVPPPMASAPAWTTALTAAESH